jgi:hypothetical protein
MNMQSGGMKTHIRGVDLEQGAKTFFDLLERSILTDEESHLDSLLRGITRYKGKLEQSVLCDR